MVTGIIAGSVTANNPYKNPNQNGTEILEGVIIMTYTGLIGISLTVVGIPLWAVGSSRKAKAVLALQKFNISAANSMAAGL